jgi:hypothetical protein
MIDPAWLWLLEPMIEPDSIAEQNIDSIYTKLKNAAEAQ